MAKHDRGAIGSGLTGVVYAFLGWGELISPSLEHVLVFSSRVAFSSWSRKRDKLRRTSVPYAKEYRHAHTRPVSATLDPPAKETAVVPQMAPPFRSTTASPYM